jgi:hypothetical protein
MKFLVALLLFLAPIVCFAEMDVNLNASYEPSSTSLTIRWQNSVKNIRSFTLQKSYDNSRWEDIYHIERNEFSLKSTEKFEDPYPAKQNFYRLKIDSGGKILYSNIIAIQPGSSVKSWRMLMPASSLIFLEYQGARAIEGVISVFVRNMSGNALVRKRYSPMDRKLSVPIDNLGRGIYVVSIVIGNEPVWSQQFSK